MSNRPCTRRRFLQVAAGAASAAAFAAPMIAGERVAGANDRLNIAVIGCAHRGADNLKGVSSENIVALCDVDDRQAAKAFAAYPQAKKFRDFRLMLAEMEKSIDAVVVSTPDHVHALAAMLAMKLGKHVYCEKPLAHDVSEVRRMTELAREKKLATQMGTQIHAGANYRRVVELVQSGAIGAVTEVRCWMGRKDNRDAARERPKDTPAIPASLDWDLWLGPAPQRPYHPTYCPGSWREWWDFGCGQFGDFGCHYMDLPFWALGLKHPTTIVADGPPPHAESTPRRLTVVWEFAKRGDAPPVKLTWSHNADFAPPPDIATVDHCILFIGERGMLAAHYDWLKLLPVEKFKGFIPPKPTIPDSVGHHKEWINACKTGSATTCNFDYSGPLAETVLLGNVAFRTGKKIEWDAAKLQAIDCPEAERFLRREYRKGWEV